MEMAVFIRITQSTPASAGVGYCERPIVDWNLVTERTQQPLEKEKLANEKGQVTHLTGQPKVIKSSN